MLDPHSWQKFLNHVHWLSPLHTLSCFAVSQHSDCQGEKYLVLNLSTQSWPSTNHKDNIGNGMSSRNTTKNAGAKPLLW